MIGGELTMATVKVMFSGPGPQANGLSATDEGIWICDQKDDRIYLVDYAGKVKTSFATPARNLSGIGYGAGVVWGASNQRPAYVYRFDPSTGHCTQAIQLDRAMEGGIHGLEVIDGALWVTRPGLGILQKLNLESGATEHEIPFPGRRSHGVYAHDGAIVCNDTNLWTVFHLDPKDGRIIDQWKFEDFEPHGLTRDPQGRVWVCDATTNRVGIVEFA
jgi:streptogramin lyase